VQHFRIAHRQRCAFRLPQHAQHEPIAQRTRQAFGAKVVKLNGLISDCGKYVADARTAKVVTTFYAKTVSGRRKKDDGYELWEQFAGAAGCDFVSHVVAGGMIGMCTTPRPSTEMQEMGWIGAGAAAAWCCASRGLRFPIAKPGRRSADAAEFFFEMLPRCFGVARAGPLGDRLMTGMLRQTKGTALR